jgi:hypothetical protein
MSRPEQILQQQVVNYLHTIPSLVFWHVPNGGGRSKAEGGIFKSMGVKPGVPDLHFILPGGKLGMIELKAGKGKVSPAQQLFIDAAQGAGAQVFVCRSVEDVAATVSRWFGPFGYRIPRVAA